MQVAMANIPVTTSTLAVEPVSANEDNSDNNSRHYYHQKKRNDLKHIGLDHGLNNGVRSPFRREVREWQRIDPSTGALVTGRLEADRWINGPLNSYGKISDSQNIAQRDGTRLSQRKQLEILQQHTASGAMQVIRAQTIQSSSSRWSSSSSAISPHLSPSIARRTMAISNCDNNSTKINTNRRNNNNNNKNDTKQQNSSKNYASKDIAIKSNYNKNNNNNNYNSKNTSRDCQNKTKGKTNNRLQSSSTEATVIAAINSDDDRNNDDQVGIIDNNVVVVNSLKLAQNNLINDHRNRMSQDHLRFDHANKNNTSNSSNCESIKHTFREDNTSTSKSKRNNDNNNNNENNNKKNYTIDSNLRNFLLLDTEPSLKLSNLMKSTTHISNNTNNNNAINTAKTKPNIIQTTSPAVVASATTTLSQSALLTAGHSFKLQNNCNDNNKNSNDNDRRNEIISDPHDAVGNSAINKVVTAVLPTLNSSTTTATITINSLLQQNTEQQPQQQQQQQQQLQQSQQQASSVSRHHLHDTQPTFNQINSSHNKSFIKSRVGGITSKYFLSNNNDNDNNNDDDDNGHGDDNGYHNDIYDKVDDVIEVGERRIEFLSNTTDQRNTLQLTPTRLQRQQYQQCYQQQQQLPQRLESLRGNYEFKSDDDQDDDQNGKHYHDHNDFAVNVVTTAASSNDKASASDFTALPQQSGNPLPTNALQRGRSISTDNLSIDWTDPNDDSIELTDESNGWCRVSKLRRSFQSAAPASRDTKVNNEFTSQKKLITRRPLDLPENSVSVAKIRNELENGRRLTTAMRNNRVDLTTLHQILDCSGSIPKPVPVRRTTFLTAESLKEIRGKLKKLSDESLYKDDFLTNHSVGTNPAVTQCAEETKGEESKMTISVTSNQLSSENKLEQNPEIRSAFTRVSPHKYSHAPRILNTATTTNTTHTALATSTTQQPHHKTNSLESRLKCRDNTAEWHLRRKSYGFEKMSPPSNNAMLRMDASTDSGLGRSSELTTWSPTETVTPVTRGTIIHFGDSGRLVPSVRSRKDHLNANDTDDNDDLRSEEIQKRHSIAVDECQYVRNTSTQVLINTHDYPDPSPDLLRNNPQQQLLPAHREMASSPANATNSNALFAQRSQQKRVGFCKTEVHFAAESGRVNIVETDGKPPPSNNFRRRRRTTCGPVQSLVRVSSPVESEQLLFGQNNTASITIVPTGKLTSFMPALLDRSMPNFTNPETRMIEKSILELSSSSDSRKAYPTTSGNDTAADCENDDISNIRGILKNKLIKPKPYHLGDNIENSDALWLLQQKAPLGLASFNNKKVEKIDNFPENESSRNASNKLIAEGNENVEQQHNSAITTCFSTKINLNLDDSTMGWKQKELPKSNVMRVQLHSPHPTLESHSQLTQTEPRYKVETKNMGDNQNNKEIDGPLRIIKEARGARKLRDHELSYFGVQLPKQIDNKPTSMTSTSKRTLPQRQRNRQAETSSSNLQEIKTSQFNDSLPNHCPKLGETIQPQRRNKNALNPPEHQSLRSPGGSKKLLTRSKNVIPDSIAYHSNEEDDTTDEHFYENITNEITSVIKVKPPPENTENGRAEAYSVQNDYERDERSLSEMAHNAELTIRALADEASQNNQRRRSFSRSRNSKPLETINEKFNSDRSIDKKLSRSTVASEAKRQNKINCPTSTLSPALNPGEDCSRTRPRSLSSEREIEIIKGRRITSRSPATQIKSQLYRKSVSSPTSSTESGRSSRTHYSSTDDECYRDEHDGRLPLQTKRSQTNSISNRISDHDKKRIVKSNERKERNLQKSNQQSYPHAIAIHLERERSAGTTRSSLRERDECATDTKSSPQRFPSNRRYKSDPEGHTTSSRASIKQKRDVHSGSLLKRSSIEHNTQQRSARKSDRSGTETQLRLSHSEGNSHHLGQHSQQHQKVCSSPVTSSSDVTKKISSSNKHKKPSTRTAADVLQNKHAYPKGTTTTTTPPTTISKTRSSRHRECQKQQQQQQRQHR